MTDTATVPPHIADIRAEKRRRKLEENQRLASLSQPIRDPRIVAALETSLEAARACQSEADGLRAINPKQNRKRIRWLENKAQAHEEKADEIRRQELERNRLYGEARDPIIRAIMRGEDVVAREVEVAEIVRDEYGGRVVHRRGPSKGLAVMKYRIETRARKLSGIQDALAKGHLEGSGRLWAPQELYDTGLMYGDAYEISVGLITNRSEGGGGGYGAKGPQLRLIEAGDHLKIVRRNLTPRQVATLDAVCGRHLRVREAAEEMHAGFPATLKALQGGLVRARSNWQHAIADGKAGQFSWSLMMANAVLELTPGL